jgi:hypothetical protein
MIVRRRLGARHPNAKQTEEKYNVWMDGKNFARGFDGRSMY